MAINLYICMYFI